ncbi:MAG: NTP transferase domain-containing protein [Oceanipulchritudo sp.]
MVSTEPVPCNGERPTLLILAAGMGSRYGGLKQLDPMGPAGETVLDYAVFDAMRAGFGKVVFVIRRDIEAAFRRSVGDRYADRIPIAYAFQELDDLPAGFTVPPGRTRPWGTGHAVRAARDLINGPFAVINADDFYGPEAYAVLYRYLVRDPVPGHPPLAMVAYRLENTLSSHGAVNRGVCRESGGILTGIEEVESIARRQDGVVQGKVASGQPVQLDSASPVSMNFWGFPATLFQALETQFRAFLEEEGASLKSEFYIPGFVDTLIRSGSHTCALLRTQARWFGVTFPEDKAVVQEQIREHIEAGTYSSPLWS